MEKIKPIGDEGPYEVVPKAAGNPAFRVVVCSFLAFLLRNGRNGAWRPSQNPVPGHKDPTEESHGMPGRDAPRRGRAAEFRRRQAEDLPKGIDPVLAGGARKPRRPTAPRSSWRRTIADGSSLPGT